LPAGFLTGRQVYFFEKISDFIIFGKFHRTQKTACSSEVLEKNIHITDPAILEALFREHYQALCLSANFIITDTEASKDIVQEFFCYCWSKRAKLGHIHDFRHYASRAVKNACLNYLKKSKNNIPYDSLFEELLPADEAADREQQQTRAVREQALWSAIARLPEQRRIIFLLSNKDDLSYAQIAGRLDISVNTVKTQIRLAYQFLRQECAGLLLAGVLIFIKNFL